MFKSRYVAKFPDARGFIPYSDEENHVWYRLYERQQRIIKDYACDTFLEGLDLLKFPEDRVPQVKEINHTLGNITGWGVHPVHAIIPAEEFFTLLSQKKFPAANFIRSPEEFDYVTEPDIFHEYFGHLPMLTCQTYADFMEHYGKIALASTEIERHYLARLYWFTVEFGLIQTAGKVKNYGGGILSSPSEAIYAVDSEIPERRPFQDGLSALRTPYRIDILQPIYYILNSFSDLYDLLRDPSHLLRLVGKAITLGDYAPTFPPVEDSSQPEDALC